MAEAISLFAALYVLAQGIERVVEVISELKWLAIRTDKMAIDASERKVKAWQSIIDALIKKGPSDPNLQKNIEKYQKYIKKEKSKIGSIKYKRTFGLWIVASGLGIFLCWAFEIGFLKIIGATPPFGWKWADYILSGIIVGSGTKPLHDIVSKIEKAAKK